VNVVTEIRKISAATTVVFLMLAVLTFLFRVEYVYSRIVFFMAWALAMFCVPLGRAFIRKRFARRDWWGYAAAVFGTGDAGRMVIQQLQAQPEIGFRIRRCWIRKRPPPKHSSAFPCIPSSKTPT
jgi:FlaA1/EpsC-like NDP-sugar epimerase